MEERPKENKEVVFITANVLTEEELLPVVLVDEVVEEVHQEGLPVVNNPRRPGIAGILPVSSLCLKADKLFLIISL